MQYQQLYLYCNQFCRQHIHCAQLSLLVSDNVFVSMNVGLNVMFGCCRMDGGGTSVIMPV